MYRENNVFLGMQARNKIVKKNYKTIYLKKTTNF